jgi:8-oxo-dGTP diphosphatase
MEPKRRPKVGSAVLVERKGKYLLGKRAKKSAHGKWILPGGGVHWGETIQDAAVREIKEETNLNIELVKLIGFLQVMNLPKDYHTVVFFHLAHAKNDHIVVSDDLLDARFFSINEIKELPTVDNVEWVLRKADVWR